MRRPSRNTLWPAALIRFRIGTDFGTGDFGWELDDITVEGTLNTPFSALVSDITTCERR